MFDKCENLRNISFNKENYLNEWLVESKSKIINSDIERRCICCNQVLRINFEKNVIRNKINGNHAIMGSKCIKKFNENNKIKLSNDRTKIRENIITLFHEGIFNKILDLDEYIIQVLFDYLKSNDKNITIDYLKKMISMYANNEIILDKLCEVLELKIEEKNIQEEEEIIKKEKEEKIRKEKEEESIRKEKIRQEKEEEKERIKQQLIREEQEKKEIKKKLFIQNNETNLVSFDCYYNTYCHRVTAKKYYITKDNVNNKICHFCYEKYIN